MVAGAEAFQASFQAESRPKFAEGWRQINFGIALFVGISSWNHGSYDFLRFVLYFSTIFYVLLFLRNGIREHGKTSILFNLDRLIFGIKNHVVLP